MALSSQKFHLTDDRSLVLDRRSKYKGKPQLNVIIAGVSHYPSLAVTPSQASSETLHLTQLTACALTSYRLYQWLLANERKLPVPLATIRFLSSPSEYDTEEKQRLSGFGATCTTDEFVNAVQRWQRDACEHPDGHTWFYFAGHGVRVESSTTLLMREFGSNITAGLLSREVLFEDILRGMIPSTRYSTMDLARQQVYFVDACRSSHRKVETEEARTMPVLAVSKVDVDTRASVPVFYSTTLGRSAFAVPGAYTLFGEALIKCLDNGVGDGEDNGGETVWEMSSIDLSRGLDFYLKELSTSHNVKAHCHPTDMRNIVLLNLDRPPFVHIDIEVVPSSARVHTQVKILDTSSNVVASQRAPINPHPHRFVLPAGHYKVDAHGDPLHAGFRDWSTERPLLFRSPHRQLPCRVSS